MRAPGATHAGTGGRGLVRSDARGSGKDLDLDPIECHLRQGSLCLLARKRCSKPPSKSSCKRQNCTVPYSHWKQRGATTMHPTTHCCLTALPGQSKIAVIKRLLADYAKVWAIMLVVLCSEQFKLDQVITKKHKMSAKMKQEQKESQEFAKLMKDLQMGKEQSLAHLQLRLSEVHLSLTSLHAVHTGLCFCSTSANTCNCHAYSNGVRQSLCARRLCHSSSHSVRLKRRKALCRIILQTTSRELSICIARANSWT